MNPDYPHLGASPNGLVECSCCGEGLLEIKCPFSFREYDPRSIDKRTFYLQRTADGPRLDRSHNYYFQIQGQLAICNRPYCDFVCWTPCGMHVERISRDETFFGNMKLKLDTFFLKAILPKILLGPESNDDKENESPGECCYCRKREIPPMIACDNPHCPVEWFHWACVGVKTEPLGSWFCPDCKALLRKSKQWHSSAECIVLIIVVFVMWYTLLFILLFTFHTITDNSVNYLLIVK